MQFDAGADPLDDAFPAPDWRRGKAPNGFGFDCASESCGRPAQVRYGVQPTNPTFVENIKSGALNRQWAENYAASQRKSPTDRITILSFTTPPGEVPGFVMVYECRCDGQVSYVSSRILAGPSGTMVFTSMARTADTAHANMNKFIAAMISASNR